MSGTLIEIIKDFQQNNELWQWDTGRQVKITPEKNAIVDEVHFSNAYSKDALVVNPQVNEQGSIVADIPNILLWQVFPINVYVVMDFPNGKGTIYEEQLKINSRKKPSDYVYTETEVRNYESLEERIKALEENGTGGGGGITKETDPTVPEWAKQPTKPSYTADEVGAASKDEFDKFVLKHEEEFDKLSEEIANKTSGIKETASGSVIVAIDSMDGKPLGLAIDGKSEQNQYSGKNLLRNNLKTRVSSGLSIIIEDEYIILNGKATTNVDLQLDFNNNNNTEWGECVGKDVIVSLYGSTTIPSGIAFFTGYLKEDFSATQESISNLDGYTYHVPEDAKYMRHWISIPSGIEFSNFILYPMVRLATVTDGTYEPYCGGIPSPNPSYPQEIRNIGVYEEASGKYAVEVKCATEDGSKETTATVYLDEPLRKGDKVYWNGGSKLRIDRYRAVEVFDGSEDEGWTESANSEKTIYRCRSNKLSSLIEKQVNQANISDLLCDSLIASSPNLTYLGNSGIAVDSGGTLCVFEPNYNTSDISLWKAHLVENPITVEYKLATPTTEEIDLSLDGLSMFYPTTILSNDCNANMEVTYIADTKAYIDKKFAELATAMV